MKLWPNPLQTTRALSLNARETGERKDSYSKAVICSSFSIASQNLDFQSFPPSTKSRFSLQSQYAITSDSNGETMEESFCQRAFLNVPVSWSLPLTRASCCNQSFYLANTIVPFGEVTAERAQQEYDKNLKKKMVGKHRHQCFPYMVYVPIFTSSPRSPRSAGRGSKARGRCC